MATGRVWAGFFHTWIQPATLDPQPGPIIKWIFFPEPRPVPLGPFSPTRFGPKRHPKLWPNQKKEKKNWTQWRTHTKYGFVCVYVMRFSNIHIKITSPWTCVESLITLEIHLGKPLCSQSTQNPLTAETSVENMEAGLRLCHPKT